MENELDEVLQPLKFEITKALPPSMQTPRNKEWLAQLPPENVIDLVRTDPRLINKHHLQEKADALEQIVFNFHGDVYLTIHNHYYPQPASSNSPPCYAQYDPTANLHGNTGQYPNPSPPLNINFSPSINVEGSRSDSRSSQDNSGNAPLGLAVFFLIGFLLVIAASI
jgi:hypothetical protein